MEETEEKVYMEIYGENIEKQLLSLYGSSNLENGNRTLNANGPTPTNTLSIENMSGATHKELVSVSKKFPKESVIARITRGVDGDHEEEDMIEYINGKHTVLATVRIN